MNRYTPMRITCDLCEASFNEAMATMDVPIYLHVHPLLLERAQSIVNARHMTPSPFVAAEPKRVIALADESITNVNEWYLETSIGSNPDETYNEASVLVSEELVNELSRYHGMLLTIQKAAEQAGLSPGTLRSYEREGLISPQRDSAGRRVFTLVEVVQARRIAAERLAGRGRGLRNTRPEA